MRQVILSTIDGVVGGVIGGLIASIGRSSFMVWQRRRHIKRVERITFAQMAPAERQKLLEQIERINALRPKRRRVS